MFKWLSELLHPKPPIPPIPPCDHQFKLIDATVIEYTDESTNYGMLVNKHNYTITNMICQCQKCGVIKVTKVDGIPQKVVYDTLGYARPNNKPKLEKTNEKGSD